MFHFHCLFVIFSLPSSSLNNFSIWVINRKILPRIELNWNACSTSHVKSHDIALAQFPSLNCYARSSLQSPYRSAKLIEMHFRFIFFLWTIAHRRKAMRKFLASAEIPRIPSKCFSTINFHSALAVHVYSKISHNDFVLPSHVSSQRREKQAITMLCIRLDLSGQQLIQVFVQHKKASLDDWPNKQGTRFRWDKQGSSSLRPLAFPISSNCLS